MEIRKVNTSEYEDALALVWKVFLEYEAPDYTEEGIHEFYRSIHDEAYLSMLSVYGAFVDNELVGVIATRKYGGHIALFFVEGKYHRQGIGRQLFEAVKADCKEDCITVNSSPYAVNIYGKLGFA
ncbi:MAG: GNAT family N-acetyltransferase [Agathobacter sp.]